MDDTEPMDDMESMNMGDADAVPAADVAGAALASGDFRALESAPAGLAGISGHADLARHDGGTTVTIEFVGLLPGSEYVAHVHAGTCFDNGGPHYMFDTSGGEMPPNEIHLVFVSDSAGGGFMTAENHQVAGPEATAVVVHQNTTGAPKIACADLS